MLVTTTLTSADETQMTSSDTSEEGGHSVETQEGKKEKQRKAKIT